MLPAGPTPRSGHRRRWHRSRGKSDKIANWILLPIRDHRFDMLEKQPSYVSHSSGMGCLFYYGQGSRLASSDRWPPLCKKITIGRAFEACFEIFRSRPVKVVIDCTRNPRVSAPFTAAHLYLHSSQTRLRPLSIAWQALRRLVGSEARTEDRARLANGGCSPSCGRRRCASARRMLAHMRRWPPALSGCKVGSRTVRPRIQCSHAPSVGDSSYSPSSLCGRLKIDD